MNGGTGNVSVVFVHEEENVTVEWPGNTTSGCVMLSCRKEYTAYIKAKNENGTSDDASVLQIESFSHSKFRILDKKTLCAVRFKFKIKRSVYGNVRILSKKAIIW